MNSRTVMVIVAFGGLGILALVIAAMMGTSALAEKPLVRASLAIAQKHDVKEVTCTLVPADKARTLRVGYTTHVLHKSLDAQTEEMEQVAKFACAEVERIELETLRRDERVSRGPIRKVAINRVWTSDRGCFKRSSVTTHEWIPPEKTPERGFRG